MQQDLPCKDKTLRLEKKSQERKTYGDYLNATQFENLSLFKRQRTYNRRRNSENLWRLRSLVALIKNSQIRYT